MFVGHTIAGRTYMTVENIYSVAVSDRHVIYKVVNYDRGVPQERGYIEFCDSTCHTIRVTKVLSYERIDESYLCDITCAVYNFHKGDVVPCCLGLHHSSKLHTTHHNPSRLRSHHPYLYSHQHTRHQSHLSTQHQSRLPIRHQSQQSTHNQSHPRAHRQRRRSICEVPYANLSNLIRHKHQGHQTPPKPSPEVDKDACWDEEVFCSALDQIEKEEHNRAPVPWEAFAEAVGVYHLVELPMVRVEGYKEGVPATRVSRWVVGRSPGNIVESMNSQQQEMLSSVSNDTSRSKHNEAIACIPSGTPLISGSDRPVAPQQVKEDDNMPKQICLSCLNRLDSSYELYARCVSAQATIKRLLDAADKDIPAPGSTHLDWAPSSKVRNSGLQLSGPSIMKIGSSVVKLQDYLMGPGDDEPQPKVMRLQESPDFSKLVQSSILLGEEGSGDMLGAKPGTPGGSTISFNQQHPANTVSQHLSTMYVSNDMMAVQSSQGLGLKPQEDPPHFLEAVTMTPEQFMEMGSSKAQSSQQLAGGAQIMVTIPPSNSLLRRSAGVASPISKNDLPATVTKLQNLGSSTSLQALTQPNLQTLTSSNHLSSSTSLQALTQPNLQTISSSNLLTPSSNLQALTPTSNFQHLKSVSNFQALTSGSNLQTLAPSSRLTVTPVALITSTPSSTDASKTFHNMMSRKPKPTTTINVGGAPHITSMLSLSDILGTSRSSSSVGTSKPPVQVVIPNSGGCLPAKPIEFGTNKHLPWQHNSGIASSLANSGTTISLLDDNDSRSPSPLDNSSPPSSPPSGGLEINTQKTSTPIQPRTIWSQGSGRGSLAKQNIALFTKRPVGKKTREAREARKALAKPTQKTIEVELSDSEDDMSKHSPLCDCALCKEKKRRVTVTATSTETKLPETEQSTEGKEKCQYCGVFFAAHIIFHHRKLHFRERFFSCIDCGKNFQTETGLESHKCQVDEIPAPS
uniref:C2H2-type domain-containing protein n=1 Tax=Timema douglasi TaxID=61478 RepID=A0A7R8VQB4_TIMDO|nr:unnamed protein product [Timema douglasi]